MEAKIPSSTFSESDTLITKPEEEKVKGEPQISIPYTKLYRYAQPLDWMLMVLGTLFAGLHGFGWPILFLLFGNITTSFTFYGRYELCDLKYETCFQNSLTTLNETQWNQTVQPHLDAFYSESIQQAYGCFYVGVATFVASAIYVYIWNFTAARQAKIIRIAYFRSMLRQDIGFHDVVSSGELNTRLSSDIKLVKKGIGEKAAFVIQCLTMAISSIIIALIYSWKATLVTLTLTPFLFLPYTVLLKLSDVFKRKELSVYVKAGSIAEEAISSIKTVVAFGCQLKEVDRYVRNLQDAKKVGILRSTATGISMGAIYFGSYAMYGLSLWYETALVIQGEINAGDMIIALFNVVLGARAIAWVSYWRCNYLKI